MRVTGGANEAGEAGGAHGAVRRRLAGGLVLGLMAWATGTQAAASPASEASDAERLQAAVRFVTAQLAADADPKQILQARAKPRVAHAGEPLQDCDLTVIVRAIEQRGAPELEEGPTGAPVVARVPVVAELVFVEAGLDGGQTPLLAGDSACTFAYERFDAQRAAFEPIETFRLRPHTAEFRTWGEAAEVWRAGAPVAGAQPRRFVAIDPDKRYVRFWVRVNVADPAAAYRLAPQFPRHWLARDAVPKLENINLRQETILTAKLSDRNPAARGDELKNDLVRMQAQLKQDRWRFDRLKAGLERLEAVESFAELPKP